MLRILPVLPTDVYRAGKVLNTSGDTHGPLSTSGDTHGPLSPRAAFDLEQDAKLKTRAFEIILSTRAFCRLQSL